jgi:hypothetical protein
MLATGVASTAPSRLRRHGYRPAVPNKVKAGFFSFTEVLDGRHREYNEWHLFDHMPENFKLTGLQWGQRWVATPELAERRLFAQGDIAAAQYLTLYLITEPVHEALEDFYALGRTLDSLGRFFKARRPHLSGPFKLIKTYAAPRVLVDPEVIPYRPNRGLFVTVQDHVDGNTSRALDEARQWYDQVHIPDLLAVRGVAGCWWFEAMSGVHASTGAEPNPRGRTIRAYWLDDDPIAFLDDLKARSPSMPMMDLSKAYRTVLVGAYRSIAWDSDFGWFD